MCARTQEHLQHRAEVTQVVFSPDGARMYSGGADGGLCVYDVAQVSWPVSGCDANVALVARM